MSFRAISLAILLGAAAPAALAQGTPPPPAPQGNPRPLTYTQMLMPDAVRRVQDRLRAIGVYSGSIDGVWGSDSETALQQFQQNNGLQVTGQLNQATAATLGINPSDLLTAPGSLPSVPVATAAPAAPPPAPAPAPATPPAATPEVHVPFALSADSVRIVQSRLRQLGFYSGYVDGVWGAGTQSAMQAFERAQNLPVTNGLNQPTVTAMGIDPTSMTPR